MKKKFSERLHERMCQIKTGLEVISKTGFEDLSQSEKLEYMRGEEQTVTPDELKELGFVIKFEGNGLLSLCDCELKKIWLDIRIGKCMDLHLEDGSERTIYDIEIPHTKKSISEYIEHVNKTFGL